MGIVWISKVALLGVFVGLISVDVRAASLTECAYIEDVERRLACYDELAGRVKEKMAEAEQPKVTTREREVIRQQAATQAIGPAPKIDDFTIAEIRRNRLKRVTYVASDGRRFRDDSPGRFEFERGDRVELRPGFLSSKLLVRNDGLQIKVKEIE
ncbi:MAG: hypothetical protein VW684_06225 [Betaproteobacteria bacterium]|jgi:hypothetical protein